MIETMGETGDKQADMVSAPLLSEKKIETILKKNLDFSHGMEYRTPTIEE